MDEHRRQDWLLAAAEKRLREELELLQVEVNEDKSRTVDLAKGESFGFLGFEFRRVRSRRGVWRPHYTPQNKEADRAVAQAQGDIPTVSVATGGTGGDDHQPDPAGVGELLRVRAFEPVLQLGAP